MFVSLMARDADVKYSNYSGGLTYGLCHLQLYPCLFFVKHWLLPSVCKAEQICWWQSHGFNMLLHRSVGD